MWCLLVVIYHNYVQRQVHTFWAAVNKDNKFRYKIRWIINKRILNKTSNIQGESFSYYAGSINRTRILMRKLKRKELPVKENNLNFSKDLNG